MSEGIDYSKTKEQSESHDIGVDERGWVYPSMAAVGLVGVELPTLPGSLTEVERLHARDFGQHVIAKIESQMNRGYIRVGPQQSAPEVFAHYIAVAKGASLLDAATLERGKSLAAEFKSETDQQEFYSQVVKPWLGSLSPKRRQP